MTKKSTKAPAKAGSVKAAPAKTEAADSKLTKTALVDLVADRTGVSKSEVAKVVGSMYDVVIESLKDGKSVALNGIGTLSVKPTAARTGVRPGTSERLTIPAGKKVAFKVATTLKGNLS